MVCGEEQRKEIETIKERVVTLRLSDADCKRISEKAGAVGMTVGQLLESFVGDLVGGTYTNGSDERMYAEAWFDRCGFAMYPDLSFLRWLIECGGLEDFFGLWDGIRDAEEELTNGDVTPGYWEPGERESVLVDIGGWRKEMGEIWMEYCSRVKHYKVGTFAEEMKKLLDWREEQFRLLTGGVKEESEG